MYEYVTPKCMPSKAACENNELGRLSVELPTAYCSSLRCWLLFWASLRLAVSVLWTGVLTLMTYQTMNYYQRHATYTTEAHHVFMFGLVAVYIAVEFGMLVTFITAGIKKSAKLYRVYYRYCILSLMIYIIAVILYYLGYNVGDFFGEIYLTYHFDDLPVVPYDGLMFFFAAIFDICLEVLVIKLIKKLMNKYSHVENNVTCEKV